MQQPLFLGLQKKRQVKVILHGTLERIYVMHQEDRHFRDYGHFLKKEKKFGLELASCERLKLELAHVGGGLIKLQNKFER